MRPLDASIPGHVGVYVVLINMDEETRRRVGEGLRRKLYDILQRYAANTPIGWIVLEDSRELRDLVRQINAAAGAPAVSVIHVYVPRESLRRWLSEYDRKLAETIMEYMNRLAARSKRSPTTYARKRALEEARKRLRRLLAQVG